MTTGTLERVAPASANTIEQALIGGDLSKLSVPERLAFYNQVCQSLGLNPLTKPFAYITLNGKLTLYALRDCTDQLRKLHHVSVAILERGKFDDAVYVVRAQATLPSGRTDESLGAVNIAGLKGENLANAIMKGETKSKRRVTLSICGLGWLDELEAETVQIPENRGTTMGMLRAEAATAELPSGDVVNTTTGEVIDEKRPALPPQHYWIEAVWSEKTGTKNGRMWNLRKVRVHTGEEFSTFDDAIAATAQKCVDAKAPAEIIGELKNDRLGPTIVSLEMKFAPGDEQIL